LSTSAAPDGYEADELRGAVIVARRGQLEAVRTALESGTLYEYAARHHASRSLPGRGIAYAAPLPNGERVVVRHNRHGGLLAPLTGDRFVTPTRAPYELSTALRLEAAGVPTPKIVAYAVYPAGLVFRRSDVASHEISDSSDLAAVLTTGSLNDRRTSLESAAGLIGLLSALGARHHDLNLKNILLARDIERGDSPVAYVLDVDRVEFGRPGDSRVTERNLDRFMRSARKWRELHGARIEEAELVRVAASVRRFVSSRPSSGARTITRS
jgi:3-deoxy-D-manno-octulosonic acid kinase